MHATSLALLATAFAAACVPARAATANVEFVNPESYTDAGRRNVIVDRDANLRALREHLEKQAGRWLPAGETLAISVTDVDLAGSYEPWQPLSREVRIVKETYPPRIDLRFRLARADGSVEKEGERTLRDTGFLIGINRYPGDNLKYEKAMLDEWLEREFAVGRKAAR